jgi:hypothetical protein
MIDGIPGLYHPLMVKLGMVNLALLLPDLVFPSSRHVGMFQPSSIAGTGL